MENLNINELIDSINSNPELKTQLINQLGIKEAKELPDDSKLKEAKPEALLDYISTLRKELEDKNKKHKSEIDTVQSSLKTQLDELMKKDYERSENEKLLYENKLKEEKKYTELIQSLENERNNFKNKTVDYESQLNKYIMKENQEKEMLLSKLPEDDRNALKNADIDIIKRFVSRIEVNSNSPQQPTITNVNYKTRDDFEKLSIQERENILMKDPDAFMRILKADAGIY